MPPERRRVLTSTLFRYGTVLHCCRNENEEVELELARRLLRHCIEHKVDVKPLMSLRNYNDKIVPNVLRAKTTNYIGRVISASAK